MDYSHGIVDQAAKNRERKYRIDAAKVQSSSSDEQFTGRRPKKNAANTTHYQKPSSD